ncbi:MAG: helix-turn-helix transcriptional regulator [Clostridia bacterium]|jgi:transcriptional regulator with XRE-family HTH domain|nr:helix-turn-helix transcriptional regulator [Clostridia bacterium]
MKCLIETVRLKKGITQKDLSERTGISQPRLSNYENNIIMPSMVTLFKIAEAMGCSISDIMDVKE